MKSKLLTIPPRDASDKAIASLIYRHIFDKGLTKIEVRHSTQTQRVSHRGIQSQLHDLARRQPLPKLEFSCRLHDNALDNATGETHIRLSYAQPAQADDETSLRGWWRRLFERNTANATTATGIAQDQDVVAEIKESLKQATRSHAKRFPAHALPAVEHVRLIVREPRIDRLLSNLKNGIDLSNWFRRQLQALDHPVSASLTASYQFRPYRAEDGTDMLGGGDLEIDLMEIVPEPSLHEDKMTVQHSAEITTQPAKLVQTERRPTQAPLPTVRHAPPPSITHPPADSGTLPPDWIEASPYVLQISIESPVPPPGKGEIRLLQLPARIDRNLLIKGGLAEFSPHSVHVASNQTPLEVDATPAGRLRLNAKPRKELGIPMYYIVNGEPRGIVHPLDVASAEARIVINSPQGVNHPEHGHLSPIVLKVAVLPVPTFEANGRMQP